MDKDLIEEFSKHLIQKSEVKDFIDDIGEVIDYFETDALSLKYIFTDPF